MTDPMIAYCGLNCIECPAYIAYQTNDEALRKKTAKKWSTPDFPVSAEDIDCIGCKSTKPPIFKWCSRCEVRSCAIEHEVVTCAHCSDYSCEKIDKLMKMLGDEAKNQLESIRKRLEHS